MGEALAHAFDSHFGQAESKAVVEERPVVERERRLCSRAKRMAHKHGMPEIVSVDGRWGPSTFHGKAAKVIKEFEPSVLGLPAIPLDEEVEVWGRRWIVKPSTLGERHGYGVFACEDIVVPDGLTYASGGRFDGPTLFPYGGVVYRRRHWNLILQQHPEWKTYQLDMDGHDKCTRRFSEQQIVDGDPVRHNNIAGYINSCVGTLRPKRKPNVEFVFCEGPPPAPYGQTYHHDHTMVMAIRTIRAGEELFSHYLWDNA